MFGLASFRFLFPFLRRELLAYIAGSCLVALSCVFMVVQPHLFGRAVGDLEQGLTGNIPWIAAAMVGFVIIRGIAQYFMRTVTIGASRRIEFRLRNHMFRHVHSLDARALGQFQTGDLMNRFTSDVDAVRAAIGPGVMYSLNTLFTAGFALALMIAVSPKLTLISLIPLIFLTITIRVLSPKAHREFTRAQEQLSDVSVHAQENFSNVKVVKAFVREDAEIERMKHLSDRYYDQNMRLARLRSLIQALFFLFGDLAILSLIAIGGYELIQGDIDLAGFAEFKGCQMLLVWPMIALGWVMTLYQRGLASARRLNAILDLEPTIHDGVAAADAGVPRGGMKSRGLGFAYDEDPVIEGIDFDLAPGKTLGIVGPTGSGKTTLLQLVPRLYETSSGELAVDGRGVPEIPLANLRDAVGYVPQEAFLFSATVEENITFGVDDASARDVQAVAELVGIHEEILGFPDGYAQRVGERGITLSGGQKQRIALARALLKRPRILLLDDVLSAVDATTETHILEGLRNWTADLTVIVVSHRLSSVRHADEILVLTDGTVTERGTHEALIARNGYYAALHRKQTLEDELENLE